MKEYLLKREPATKKTGSEPGSGGGGATILPFVKKLKPKIPDMSMPKDQRFDDFIEGMKYQKNMTELNPLRNDPQMIKKVGAGISAGVLGSAGAEKAKKFLEDLKKKDK